AFAIAPPDFAPGVTAARLLLGVLRGLGRVGRCLEQGLAALSQRRRVCLEFSVGKLSQFGQILGPQEEARMSIWNCSKNAVAIERRGAESSIIDTGCQAEGTGLAPVGPRPVR